MKRFKRAGTIRTYSGKTHNTPSAATISPITASKVSRFLSMPFIRLAMSRMLKSCSGCFVYKYLTD